MLPDVSAAKLSFGDAPAAAAFLAVSEIKGHQFHGFNLCSV